MNLLPLGRAGLTGVGALPQDTTVGIRPEDLVVMAHEPAAGGVALDLTVDAAEHVGAETFVYGHLESGGDVIVRVAGDTAPPLGSKIRAGAPREKLHLFGGDGRRLAES
jgi:sn-glycerol 3-phosphate transport system ATP-binding protein